MALCDTQVISFTGVASIPSQDEAKSEWLPSYLICKRKGRLLTGS